MARNERSARADTKRSPVLWSQPRILYLTLYNLLFAALWASIGISAISHASKGKYVLFEAVEPRARWVQTITLIEVIHAVVGKTASKVRFDLSRH